MKEIQRILSFEQIKEKDNIQASCAATWLNLENVLDEKDHAYFGNQYKLLTSPLQRTPKVEYPLAQNDLA